MKEFHVIIVSSGKALIHALAVEEDRETVVRKMTEDLPQIKESSIFHNEVVFFLVQEMKR